MSEHPYDRPICGHKYCPPERCGYMHEPGKLLKGITVSGNRISITRLDEQGNPVGAPIEVASMINSLSIDLAPEEIVDWDLTTDKTLTVDIELCAVSPEVIRILTGTPPYGDIPTEVWSRPWWYRWLPRFLKHMIKSRWIHRGYGG